MDSWKPIRIDADTPFFKDVFQQVIKHPDVQFPKEEVIITANNKKYLFKFQWQNGDICGIDVFKEEEY